MRQQDCASAQPQIPAPALIRYAEDLVVLHPDLAVVQSAQSALADGLVAFGLTLKPAKLESLIRSMPITGI